MPCPFQRRPNLPFQNAKLDMSPRMATRHAKMRGPQEQKAVRLGQTTAQPYGLRAWFRGTVYRRHKSRHECRLGKQECLRHGGARGRVEEPRRRAYVDRQNCRSLLCLW